MKTRFFSSLLLLAGFSIHAQDNSSGLNHYQIRMHQVITDPSFEPLLREVTGAKEVTYNSEDSVYVVGTTWTLDKKVVSGKLQKNVFPVKSIETAMESFPKFVDTGDPEKDDQRYSAEKARWIARYPQEYKAMKNEQSLKH